MLRQVVYFYNGVSTGESRRTDNGRLPQRTANVQNVRAHFHVHGPRNDFMAGGAKGQLYKNSYSSML